MGDPVEELVRNWSDVDLSIVNLRIKHLEKWLYKTYEPNKFGNGDFWVRLAKWLSNVPDDENKKILFRLIPELLFIGPAEFEEMYRCAYQGPIARWLVDVENIDIFDVDANSKLNAAANNTWFCPVTDSLRINSFFHINHISASANLRPDWHSLFRLGDIYKINGYIRANGVKRLVLIEDFVGGGDQSLEAVEWAAKHIHDVSILFVPLVICPNGAHRARELAERLSATRPHSLRYEAVIELPESAFFTKTTSPFDFVGYSDKLRQLVEDTYPAVSGGAPPGQDKPYHPYGYPPHDPTGGLVVMYSNTPDNTLPLVHWAPKVGSWHPVFPRHSRV